MPRSNHEMPLAVMPPYTLRRRACATRSPWTTHSDRPVVDVTKTIAAATVSLTDVSRILCMRVELAAETTALSAPGAPIASA